MMTWFRRVGLLVFAGGGAWGAFHLLGRLVQRVDGGAEYHLTSEAVLLVVPVCVVGALVGAFVGGILLPRDSQ